MKFTYIRLPYKQVTIYPIGDIHYGSPQCNEALVKKVIAEIKDNPEARWIGMGDLIENAIVGSLGDVYNQTVSPQEQVEAVAALLSLSRTRGCL